MTTERQDRPIGRATTLIAAMLLVGACAPTGPVESMISDPPSARPTATTPTEATGRIFDTIATLRDGEDELPISLLDRTGLVTGMEALAGGDPSEDGVTDAVEGTGLIYSWTGGACDERTLLTFERTEDGFRLLTLTQTSGDSCILIGITRQIAIHLSEVVPARSVTVAPGVP